MDRIIEMSREIYNIESPAGVYIIEGLFEERYYIGSSKNIRKRIIQHETMLKAAIHKKLFRLNQIGGFCHRGGIRLPMADSAIIGGFCFGRHDVTIGGFRLPVA